jgi:hypothetical protein
MTSGTTETSGRAAQRRRTRKAMGTPLPRRSKGG